MINNSMQYRWSLNSVKRKDAAQDLPIGMSYSPINKGLKDGSIRKYPQISLTIYLKGKTKRFKKLYTIGLDEFGHCRTTREQAIKKLTILGNAYADDVMSNGILNQNMIFLKKQKGLML